MIEGLGWLGFIHIMMGYYLNAKQKIECFYFWALGNICFLIYASYIDALPQVAMSLFVLVMNWYGYRSWKKTMERG